MDIIAKNELNEVVGDKVLIIKVFWYNNTNVNGIGFSLSNRTNGLMLGLVEYAS